MTEMQIYQGGELSAALKEPKLSETKSKLINEFLLRMYLILGLSKTNRPDEDSQQLLVELFKVEFKRFTLKEIELAFSLVRQGRIKHNLTLYDKTFSIQYVADVMLEYEKYKRSHRDFKRHIELPEKPPPTDAEIYKTMREGVIELFEQFKNKEIKLVDVKWFFYKVLVDDAKVFTPTSERKKEYFQRAKVLVEEKERLKNAERVLRPFDFADMVKDIKPKEVEDTAIMRAKEMLIWEFFKNLEEMEMDLGEMMPDDLII